ncbi:MAG: hypothetical protein LC104_04105 [Bacteroidales bacterium]|nr:hypothetical protein [Bacteroidales bacterium]
MTTICPSCQASLQFDAEFAGHDVRCGQCGNIFTAIAAASSESTGPQRFREELPYIRRRFDPQVMATRPATTGSGATAFLLGIVAILTWWCPPLGLIAGSLAVILACTSLQTTTRRLAVIGMILGIASVMFSLGCGVIYGVVIHHQHELERHSGGNQAPFLRE